MSSTVIEDVCSTCGKYVRRSNMARHLKAHTVKNFLCFYTSHIKKENFNKRKEQELGRPSIISIHINTKRNKDILR